MLLLSGAAPSSPLQLQQRQRHPQRKPHVAPCSSTAVHACMRRRQWGRRSVVSAAATAQPAPPSSSAGAAAAAATAQPAPPSSSAVAAAAAAEGVADRDELALRLTDELRLLTTERDEALRVGEEAARAAVKLEEMRDLLLTLAERRVADGDDAGAREVLREKAGVVEVLARTAERATANLALAARLADKLADVQGRLVAVLRGSDGGGDSAAAGGGSTPATPEATGPTAAAVAAEAAAAAGPSPAAAHDASATSAVGKEQQQERGEPSSSSSSSSSSSGGVSSGGSEGAGNAGAAWEAPWERSLAEARERIAAAERQAGAAAAAATAAGSTGAWRARETVEQARERLRRESLASIEEARRRIAASAGESIEAARRRIAEADAHALARVRELMERRRAGGWVSEDELEWAFRQLQETAWRR